MICALGRATVIMGLAVLLAGLTAGCSENPALPDEQSQPTLNSGHRHVAWQVERAACRGNRFCLDSIVVEWNAGSNPEIRVTVAGELGVLSQSAGITPDDFDAFEQLAAAVISGREPPAGETSESVDVFSGDAGWRAGIENSEDPVVVQFRELGRELVARYFSGD